MPDVNQALLCLGDAVAASKNVQKMTGDPIHCKSCKCVTFVKDLPRPFSDANICYYNSAALNMFSKVERAPPVALSSSEEISHWKCEFCGVLNTCRIDKVSLFLLSLARSRARRRKRSRKVHSQST